MFDVCSSHGISTYHHTHRHCALWLMGEAAMLMLAQRPLVVLTMVTERRGNARLSPPQNVQMRGLCVGGG